MSQAGRLDDDRRFAGRTPGAVEPFFAECLVLLPVGRALDVAAGTGRHSIAAARAGLRVVAVDHSLVALNGLAATARAEELNISPVVAELENFPIRAQTYQVVLNVNFLDRRLVPRLKEGIARGGMMVFDTFLIDQAASGHPRNPDFLLRHYELREMLEGFELIRYREGLTVYPDGSSAWRAGALARRP